MTNLNFTDFGELARQAKERQEFEEYQEIQKRETRQQRKQQEWNAEKGKIAEYLAHFFCVSKKEAEALIVGSEEIPQEWTGPKYIWYFQISGLPACVLLLAKLNYKNKPEIMVATAHHSRHIKDLTEMVEAIESLTPKKGA